MWVVVFMHCFSVDSIFLGGLSHSRCQTWVYSFIAIWAFWGFTTRTTLACFLSLFSYHETQCGDGWVTWK